MPEAIAHVVDLGLKQWLVDAVVQFQRIVFEVVKFFLRAEVEDVFMALRADQALATMLIIARI